MALDVAKIEEKIDRAIAGALPISDEIGGIAFRDMAEVMEFAKLMSVASGAIPQHLRQNPGACLAICIQALEWRMSPFAVANKSYMANDRLAYESQLIHAVVEARAPLKGRLRYQIVGEGDERRCVVSGTFKGEDKPHEYISETLATLRGARGTNDRGQVRGSPLWQNQPEIQLFYSASRSWARLYCPDVLLGIYAREELAGADATRDVTPADVKQSLTDRLKARSDKQRRGFDHDHVSRETSKAKGGGQVLEDILPTGKAAGAAAGTGTGTGSAKPEERTSEDTAREEQALPLRATYDDSKQI